MWAGGMLGSGLCSFVTCLTAVYIRDCVAHGSEEDICGGLL